MLWIMRQRSPFSKIRPNFLLGAASGIMTGSVIDYDQNVMGAYD